MNTQEYITENYLSQTIGKMVAVDYRKAMVFKSHGIDFCCGGNISLEEAARNHNVPLEQLISELRAVDESETVATDYASWTTARLIDHIVKRHHLYVSNTIEQLIPMLDKVERVHGDRHPELTDVNRVFREVANELVSHMHKEEKILFPAILELENEQAAPRFETVQGPISRMEHEHDLAGELMREIASLTENYTLPKGACATYTVVYKVLDEFEQDLHTHIHLENNILFPRALELEQERNR